MVVLVTALIQICSGGLVTSHNAGMAVPDWPNTFGYNMFLFPIEQWVGGIFYEHSHRLIGSGLGLLVILQTALVFLLDSRRFVRILAVGALVGVCVQGLLGGLRVEFAKDEIGIFHAALAQLFLVLIGVLALVTSRWWMEGKLGHLQEPSSVLRWTLVGATALIFSQLVLAATMRHEHIGLAVPDFPLAYGQFYPKTDAVTLAKINTDRQARAERIITARTIHLHLAHRFNALLILITVLACARGLRHLGLSAIAWTWVALIFLQIGLGAWTVWSQKAADITTLHVAIGALIFLLSVLVTMIGWVRARGGRDETFLPSTSSEAARTLSA
jgi:cytochrome c oxidase assembly protein subunit 15